MAPNSTSRKAPPLSSNSKPSLSKFVKKTSTDDGFADNGRAKKIKVGHDSSKRPPKLAKRTTWDTDVANAKGKDQTSTPAILNRTSPSTVKSFASKQPMTDSANVVRCNHCKRAILKHRAKSHIEECIAKKQEKQRRKKEAKDARDADRRRAERGGESSSEEEDVIDSSVGRKTDGAMAGKKRKAEDVDSNNGPKKKKKKDLEPKAKAPRPKAPVDVEKQCGVELPQGGQCARSLTCKSHSMGAKRAVPGRSAPYDKLLAEYQRKNQAKLQKAALESQPQLPDDDLAPTGPIDSDEEKDLVLAAIARARPQPLYQPSIVPLRHKYRHVRLREMLGNAFGGRSGAGLFGAPAGGNAVAAASTT